MRLRDGKVTIRPIAGTRPRGKDAAEDKALAEDLLSDPKELAEHLMLLDLGRNDVGRVAKIGTVEVTEQMTVEYYSHVMHIVSNVKAKSRPSTMRCRRLPRAFRRAPYRARPRCGPWKSSTSWNRIGAASMPAASAISAPMATWIPALRLRTAVVKDGKMYVQAGGGIVYDSSPEGEFQESCNKARALLRAAEEAVRFAASGGGR